MEWKRSMTGLPLCVQLLRDNDTMALNLKENSEAGVNILALAQLLTYKVMVRTGMLARQREVWEEDMQQESALELTRQATHGYPPRLAYYFARKSMVKWVQRRVWGILEPTATEKREGFQTVVPETRRWTEREHDRTPLLATERAHTPETLLLERDAEVDPRAVCIEQFFAIVYDLVLNRSARSCKYELAWYDAEVLALKLQGYSVSAIAVLLEVEPTVVYQRLHRARRRLQQYPVAEVTEWYQDVVAGRRRLPNPRTQAAVVAQYVAERERDYAQRRTTTPSQVQRTKWLSLARKYWVHLEQNNAA